MFAGHNQKSFEQADGSHIGEEVRITGMIISGYHLLAKLMKYMLFGLRQSKRDRKW